MPMENLEIAKVLSQMADLLEIQDANPFRVRAYRNAARLVDGHAMASERLEINYSTKKIGKLEDISL